MYSESFPFGKACHGAVRSPYAIAIFRNRISNSKDVKCRASLSLCSSLNTLPPSTFCHVRCVLVPYVNSKTAHQILNGKLNHAIDYI